MKDLVFKMLILFTSLFIMNCGGGKPDAMDLIVGDLGDVIPWEWDKNGVGFFPSENQEKYTLYGFDKDPSGDEPETYVSVPAYGYTYIDIVTESNEDLYDKIEICNVNTTNVYLSGSLDLEQINNILKIEGHTSGSEKIELCGVIGNESIKTGISLNIKIYPLKNYEFEYFKVKNVNTINSKILYPASVNELEEKMNDIFSQANVNISITQLSENEAQNIYNTNTFTVVASWENQNDIENDFYVVDENVENYIKSNKKRDY